MTATLKATVLKEASSSTDNLTLGTSGEVGVGGANYGTSGQILTSGGTGASPSWADAPASGSSLVSSQAFTASGTYTPTSGTTSAIMFIQAAGCGCSGSADDVDGDGGGGGGCVVLYINATDFASIGTPTVTIGAGGSGGSNLGGDGSNGGNTSVGTLAEAQGGRLGVGGDSTTPNGRGGGFVTQGTYTITGQNGFLALAAASDVAGRGGNSVFGTGGAGGTPGNNGSPGSDYGSGGGGGCSTGTAGRTGGAGADGYVLVLEYA